MNDSLAHIGFIDLEDDVKIDSNNTAQMVNSPMPPSIYALRQHAERIRRELHEIHAVFKQTGDTKLLARQAELSVEYERALHQVRKRLQGRTDGPFGS